MNSKIQELRRSSLAVKDGIAHFEMQDTASRNALSQELKADYSDMISQVCGDTSLHALILSGTGGAFCAGGDLKSLAADTAGSTRNVEGIRRRLHDSHRWFHDLYNLELPVIAAVDGPAFGAGFSLALASDFILATPRASFCMVFNRIGALPDLAALYMLPRMIGLRRAKELMMSTRVVAPDEALSLGIVHSVHAQDEIMNSAWRMAECFASGSKEALGMTKLFANRSFELDYQTMAELEANGQATCLTNDYFREAVGNFLAGRPLRYSWNRVTKTDRHPAESAPLL